jgi:Zn-dependent M28 family amino/carboxypeptidase
MNRSFWLGIAPVAALALAFGSTPLARADNGTDSFALRGALSSGGIGTHLTALQGIATANSGNRAAGTPGYAASAAYVASKLATAGYTVSTQSFTYDKFFENTDAVLAQTAPVPTPYTYLTDFFTMTYSGSGDVTAPVTAVDLLLPPTGGSTSGCEPADFIGFPAGNIALIQRGTCSFRVKADNAKAAGAVGVIIFNEGNLPDRIDLFGGTLESPQAGLPVVSASFALGNALAATTGLRMRLKVDARIETVDSVNVLADTPTGRADRLVVVGAHLDSVAEGAGINDNGSGTATTLEIALQMSNLNITPRNKVRFAFWGGEEDGLIGSTHYVQQLSKTEIRKHHVNLNFDMLGSPNFVRFVYDGNGSIGDAGPNGSDVIESVFLDYFAGQGLAAAPTGFDGRSDYGPFIEAGIPAGGLFSGAEDVKSAEEAAVYGGTAGVAYDACYHAACDGIANINNTALDQLGDAAAHAILTFAMTTSAVNGTSQGQGSGNSDFEFQGPRARK